GDCKYTGFKSAVAEEVRRSNAQHNANFSNIHAGTFSLWLQQRSPGGQEGICRKWQAIPAAKQAPGSSHPVSQRLKARFPLLRGLLPTGRGGPGSATMARRF